MGWGGRVFRFRLLIILLIAWLFFILSFERIVNQTDLSTLSIAPFVYVLIVLTTIFVILLLPQYKISGRNLLLALSALYAATKVISVLINPITDASVFLASLTLELVVFLTSNYLTLSLTNWFCHYNEGLKQAIFSPISSQIEEKYQNANSIEQRIAAARRFERELTLLYIRFDKVMGSKPGISWEENSDARDVLFHMRMAELLSFLSPNALKAWNQSDLMMCVPFDTQQNSELASQIKEVFSNVLKVEVNVGMAAFPQDGLVLKDLIENARSAQ
jgi:hypothetical protein